MAQIWKQKRQRAGEPSRGRISKKLKPKPGSRGHKPANFTPQFYDNLSNIWLTRRALRELNRRNENRPSSEHRSRIEILETRRAKLAALVKLGISGIAVFAAAGGPDLNDLKGYPEPANVAPIGASISSHSNHDDEPVFSSGGSRRTSETSKSMHSSAYDGNFEQYYADCRFYHLNYGMRSPKPNNYDEIREALKIPRRYPSRSIVPETDYEEFLDKSEAVSEGASTSNVISHITSDTNILSSGYVPFTNLTAIIGVENATANIVPHFFDGARPGAVNSRVRKDLNGMIIPSEIAGVPIAPKLFLAAKGDDEERRAKRHAALEGAYGAYIMHALQNYGRCGGPMYDGNAYAFTATLVNGYLCLYAHHLTPPTKDGERPGCHSTLLRAFNLYDDLTYLEGIQALKSLRRKAKEARDRFIKASNAKAGSLNVG